MFTCRRCHYKSPEKHCLIRHLQKLKPCECLFENIERNILIEELKKPKLRDDGDFTCNLCGQCYKSRQGLYKHKFLCQAEKKHLLDMDFKKEILGEIKQIIESLKPVNINNTTINNIQNINNIQQNIIINTFGKESVEYISPDFMKSCLLNGNKGLSRFIKDIHFNQDHPENQNIRAKSTKKSLLEKYENNQWIVCDCNNTLDELIKNNYRILYKHYIDNKDSDDDLCNKQEYINDYFIKICTKNDNEYFKLRRDICVMVYNNTLYVLEQDI